MMTYDDIDQDLVLREEVIPHPYTYLPAHALRMKNGDLRWFDFENKKELPPFFGPVDEDGVIQAKIDEWYAERKKESTS